MLSEGDGVFVLSSTSVNYGHKLKLPCAVQWVNSGVKPTLAARREIFCLLKPAA
jgi:hypothetical protein